MIDLNSLSISLGATASHQAHIPLCKKKKNQTFHRNMTKPPKFENTPQPKFKVMYRRVISRVMYMIQVTDSWRREEVANFLQMTDDSHRQAREKLTCKFLNRLLLLIMT